MKVDWRYFSNIGKTRSVSTERNKRKTFSKRFDFLPRYYSDIAEPTLEPTDRFMGIVNRWANRPMQLGQTRMALVRFILVLTTNNRLWRSRQALFLAFLVSSIAVTFSTAYKNLLKRALSKVDVEGVDEGELVEQERELEEYEKELAQMGVEDTDEDVEELVSRKGGAAEKTTEVPYAVQSAYNKALFLSNQFASFLLSTYILFFVEKYKEEIIYAEEEAKAQSSEGAEVNTPAIIKLLIKNIGLRIIARNIGRYIPFLLQTLRYYLDPNYKVSLRAFVIGQKTLSAISTLVTVKVAQVVAENINAEYGMSFDGAIMLSNKTRHKKYSMHEDFSERYKGVYGEEDILDKDAAYLDEELTSGLELEEGVMDMLETQDTDMDHDEVEEYPTVQDEEFLEDEYEEDVYEESDIEPNTFSRVFYSVKPRRRSRMFARRFVSRYHGRDPERLVRDHKFWSDLAKSLYREFYSYFAENGKDEEEAKDAAEEATVVVQKAVLEGLVESLEDAAAKAAELVGEEAERDTDEEEDADNWWDMLEDQDEDEEDEGKDEEEDEEEEDEEEEDDEGDEEDEEEDEEEERAESNRYSRYYARRKGVKKPKILSKYRSRKNK